MRFGLTGEVLSSRRARGHAREAKRFFASGAGENQAEGRMGLCARAQRVEQHDQTEQGARALPGALMRSPRRNWRKDVTTRIADPRHTACNAPPVGALDRIRSARRAPGVARTMSFGQRVWRFAGGRTDTDLPLREISYMKGNLRSGFSFYFKVGLSDLS